MHLEEFNQLPAVDAVSALYGCCHCQTWAETVSAARPFASVDDLQTRARQVWLQANEAEILDAFSGHARIGDIELLRSRYAGRATQEQGQVLHANERVIQDLYRLNREYEAKNGFIFIVCASGKSAEEMLGLLQERIDNSRPLELLNGAREQGEITRLRIAQLIDSHY
ncbi:MAG TPA: 2-oxo-4-hydroxy-4-carboxy-5-ureidoimidazoline decarboxylase [Cellvibrio sp.]|nr:2-oxo-4-hydroxy-4-carboxy-5-ureidoimidazoline decarboxylase [Cellvibrio sp.]